MNYTSLLVQLLPAAWLPYLKAIVVVLGGAASSVIATYPGVDHRWVIASLALTALVHYFTPNVQPVKLMPVVAVSAQDESEWITYTDKPEPAPVTVQTQAQPAVTAQLPPPAAPAAPPVAEVGV